MAVKATEEQVEGEAPEERVDAEVPEEQVAVEPSQHAKDHQLSKQQGPPQPDTEQTVRGPQLRPRPTSPPSPPLALTPHPSNPSLAKLPPPPLLSLTLQLCAARQLNPRRS